jgi:hypothetical protein
MNSTAPAPSRFCPGQCDEALTGFDCRDVQAPSEKGTRQLAAPAPDLKHRITASDPRDLTSPVDEFVRISRAIAVVLSRYLAKNLAVSTCGGFWPPCHPLASVQAWQESSSVSLPLGRARPSAGHDIRGAPAWPPRGQSPADGARSPCRAATSRKGRTGQDSQNRFGHAGSVGGTPTLPPPYRRSVTQISTAVRCASRLKRLA